MQGHTWDVTASAAVLSNIMLQIRLEEAQHERQFLVRMGIIPKGQPQMAACPRDNPNRHHVQRATPKGSMSRGQPQEAQFQCSQWCYLAVFQHASEVVEAHVEDISAVASWVEGEG